MSSPTDLNVLTKRIRFTFGKNVTAAKVAASGTGHASTHGGGKGPLSMQLSHFSARSVTRIASMGHASSQSPQPVHASSSTVRVLPRGTMAKQGQARAQGARSGSQCTHLTALPSSIRTRPSGQASAHSPQPTHPGRPTQEVASSLWSNLPPVPSTFRPPSSVSSVSPPRSGGRTSSAASGTPRRVSSPWVCR